MIREDDGLMSQAMLLSMIIPTIIGGIAAAIFMNLQVTHIKDAIAKSENSADQLSALILSDLNDGYPVAYLTMSQQALQDATTYHNTEDGSYAYVSKFAADSNGWTYVQETAFSSPTAIKGRDYTYKYRASDSMSYIGVSQLGGLTGTQETNGTTDLTTTDPSPTKGRPVWARSTAGIQNMGIYEMVPESASVSDYPPAPWQAGQRPGVVINPRIIRSIQYGVILAWNKPDNASLSGLNGYEIANVDPVVPAGCGWMSDSPGAYPGADGFLILNPDLRAAPSAWKCNPLQGPTNFSQLTIRGDSPNGLGVITTVTLNKLPVSSDLIPAPPTTVPTGLTVDATRTTGSDVHWTGVTCATGSTPAYQFVWVAGATGTGPWQSTTTYSAINGNSQPLTWLVSAKCVGEFNDSTIVQSAALTYIPISSPPTNLQVVTSTMTSTGVSWTGVTCPASTSPQYRITTFTLGGSPLSTLAWVTGITGTISTAAGDGIKWSVQAKCVDGSSSSPIAISATNSFVAPPNAATSLRVIGTPTVSAAYLAWNATSCASGATAEYKFQFQPSSSGEVFQTGVSITATAPTPGQQNVNWRVEARCTYGTYSSPLTISANGPQYNYDVAAPTGTFTTTGNGVSTIYPSGSTMTCGAGTSLVWQGVRTGTPANYSVVTGSWVSGSTMAIPGGNYLGWTVTAHLNAACTASGVLSSIVTSADTGWTPAVPYPAIPSSIVQYQSGIASIEWSWATCPSGSSGQYTTHVTRSSPYVDGWADYNGGTWPVYDPGTLAPSGTTIYYDVYSRCDAVNADSQWMIRRAYWVGANSGGYPAWTADAAWLQ